MKRPRMIVELPREVQMAIRLRAIKNRTTTGAVVAEAVRRVFPADVQNAVNTLAAKGEPS